MTIHADAIVPITEATKHFKATCDKTKQLGTTFIFKKIPIKTFYNKKESCALMYLLYFASLSFFGVSYGNPKG